MGNNILFHSLTVDRIGAFLPFLSFIRIPDINRFLHGDRTSAACKTFLLFRLIQFSFYLAIRLSVNRLIFPAFLQIRGIRYPPFPSPVPPLVNVFSSLWHK